MFGTPWNGVVTAAVVKTNVDLCNEFIESAENSTFSSWSTNDMNDQYDTAIFYNATEAEERKGSCDYSQMAQTVEKLYPSARYLLISKDSLAAMKKFEDEPDTILSMASVTMDDAKEINSMLRNETGALIIDGVALLNIDAYSRAYVDACNCPSDEEVLERKALWATLLRVGCALSILGSTYILLSLVSTSTRRKKNLSLLFNRLLLSICCFDILASIALFWGRWAAPASPPGDFQKYYSQAQWDIDNPDAMGNTLTCTLQGTLIQLGIFGSTVFTGFLAIHTLLVVKYSWNEQTMKKVEVLLFALGISCALITASVAVGLKLIDVSDIGFCWIEISPAPCDSDALGPLFDGYCEDNLKGENPLIFQIGLAMGWAFLTLLVIIYAMTSLFFFVRYHEDLAARWTLTAQTRRQQKLVLARSMMYTFVYLVIWLPCAVSIAVDSAPARTVVAVVLPLQGVFNAIIYSGVIDEYCIIRPTAREVARSSTVQISQDS